VPTYEYTLYTNCIAITFGSLKRHHRLIYNDARQKYCDKEAENGDNYTVT